MSTKSFGVKNLKEMFGFLCEKNVPLALGAIPGNGQHAPIESVLCPLEARLQSVRVVAR